MDKKTTTTVSSLLYQLFKKAGLKGVDIHYDSGYIGDSDRNIFAARHTYHASPLQINNTFADSDERCPRV